MKNSAWKPVSSPARRRFAAVGAAAVVCLLAWAGAGADNEERLWVEARINGQPVHLAFDTGAEGAALFRQAAERLKLRVINAPGGDKPLPGQVAIQWTEPLKLSVWKRTVRTRFGVVDMPAGLHEEMDGVLGWGTLQDNVIHIDAADLRFELLEKIPKSAAGWPKFPLRPHASVLTMVSPDPDTGKKYVVLDTGDQRWTSLCESRWNQWTASHPAAPRSLSAYYMPGSGLVVGDVYWADALTLGPLQLANVLVEKANFTQNGMGGPEFLAALGVNALKQFDVYVDGRKGFVYLQPKAAVPAPPPEHNRIGALFSPETMEQDDLIAHVLEGSPAWEAGIRNGDLLLAIDGADTTHWRINTTLMPMKQFWQRPPGTKLQLKLKRGEKEFETIVTLRNLIGPDVKAESQASPKPAAD